MNDSFSPFERMSIFGVGRNKSIDGFTHVPGRECIESPESLTPQYAKPAFDLVEPGGMGRSVMEMDIGMPCEPVHEGFVAKINLSIPIHYFIFI